MEKQEVTAYQWYVVGLLLVVSLFAYVDRLVIGLLIDPIKQELGISDSQAGALVGLAFTMTYATIGLPMGRLVDRYPRNIILAGVLALWSASTIFSGLALTFAAMFIARMGVGTGEAGSNPAAVSIIGSVFPPDKVPYALSIYGVGIYGGGGLALVLGGQLTAQIASLGPIELFGETVSVWRVVFMCLGLPGLILAPIVWLTIRDPRHGTKARAAIETHGDAMTLTEVTTYVRKRRRLFPVLFLSFAAFGFYIYAVQGWYPTMLIRNYGFTPHDISIYYGIPYLISGVGGALSAGHIVNFLRKRGHEDATVLVCVGTSAIAIIPAILGPIVPNQFLCLLCISIVVCMAAIQQTTAFSVLIAITPPQMRGVITALYVLTLNLTSGALGALAVGVMADHVFGAGGLGTAMMIIGMIGFPIATIGFLASRPAYVLAARLVAQESAPRPA